MTKQDVIEQLCKMMGRSWETIDPNGHEACDCVCNEHGDREYHNAGHALEFMEEAVSDAIAAYHKRQERSERSE